MNTKRIEELGACADAVKWLETQPSLAAAWRACERAEWMMWLLGRTSKSEPWYDERKPLVLLACAVARTALKYVKAGEDRPRAVIETVEAWCRGEATREQVVNARADAYAAADAAAAHAAAAYAAYAADAAAYAADAHAADAAAYAYAAAAADAADAHAADAAAYAYAARAASRKESADIVRKHFPKPPTWRKKAQQ